LQEGKVVEVTVSYITSDANIFIQLYNSVIHGIQQKISHLEPEKLTGSSPIKLAKGKIYLAQYTDGIWYRATITSANEKKVIIFLLRLSLASNLDHFRPLLCSSILETTLL
jgi:Tudor domain